MPVGPISRLKRDAWTATQCFAVKIAFRNENSEKAEWMVK